MHHKFACTFIRSDGTRCFAPKVKGTQFCINHPLEEKLLPAVAIQNLSLETYADVTNFKKQIVEKVNASILGLDHAEQMMKILTSLENSMQLRDKMDPDRESKRQFSIEAAIQAARRISSKQATDMLRAGGTDFLDFLANPQVIEVAAIDEDEDEGPKPIAELFPPLPDPTPEIEEVKVPMPKYAAMRRAAAEKRIKTLKNRLMDTLFAEEVDPEEIEFDD